MNDLDLAFGILMGNVILAVSDSSHKLASRVGKMELEMYYYNRGVLCGPHVWHITTHGVPLLLAEALARLPLQHQCILGN